MPATSGNGMVSWTGHRGLFLGDHNVWTDEAKVEPVLSIALIEQALFFDSARCACSKDAIKTC